MFIGKTYFGPIMSLLFVEMSHFGQNEFVCQFKMQTLQKPEKHKTRQSGTFCGVKLFSAAFDLSVGGNVIFGQFRAFFQRNFLAENELFFVNFRLKHFKTHKRLKLVIVACCVVQNIFGSI